MSADELVPEAWRTEFILAMRAREADGRRIGDALAEVVQFCHDSAQPATAAFGGAAEYAAAFGTSPRVAPPRGDALARAVALVGMLLVLW